MKTKGGRNVGPLGGVGVMKDKEIKLKGDSHTWSINSMNNR